MQLDLLQILNLRNLSSVDLKLHPQFNVIEGQNGEGKTSLLEAIHVLTTGRSFRTAKAGPMIRFGEKSCLVSGVVSKRNIENNQNALGFSMSDPIRVGIERFAMGSPKIRLNEEDCQSIVQLARVLPIQLIHTETYDLLEATPQCRRQFLDWLMFHVEHSFYESWLRFKKALAQRNAALKNGRWGTADIRVWDRELVEMGEILDRARCAMVDKFTPLFIEILSELLKINGKVSIEYSRGWSEDLSLLEALDRSFNRDQEWGYTTVGPQRADLEFKLGKVSAKNVLSRGQLKLFVCALLITRAHLLHQKTAKRCVFLVDDLNSELDKEANRRLTESLYEWGGQVLVTAIEGETVTEILKKKNHKMFHVEQGSVCEV